MSKTGLLLDFALFGGPRGRGGPNIGWLILELDAAYVRDQWLPELVKQHLHNEGDAIYQVDAHSVDTPATSIFSLNGGARLTDPQVTEKFNHSGRADDNDSRWIIGVSQEPGALEAVVATSRRRNLAVAGLVNTLILGAGILLVRHTRRSRQLAERQMNFVADVSHELRTPLAVIRGAAHNLQRGVVQSPERVGEYSGLIIQHAEQLTDMVEQVLELAGAQRSNAMQFQPVSMEEVLRASVAACSAETQTAGCEVELKVPSALPEVSGDAAALRRVFQNLIVNAAKHGATGHWIGVAARFMAPSTVEIQVSDRGAGVPQDEQAHIFDAFVRGSAAQLAQTRGSGLGLSLVREIVQAHKGTVLLRSEPEQGAVFTVQLPVVQS